MKKILNWFKNLFTKKKKSAGAYEISNTIGGGLL
jgi:hypothetical protein